MGHTMVSFMSVCICLVFWNMNHFVCSTNSSYVVRSPRSVHDDVFDHWPLCWISHADLHFLKYSSVTLSYKYISVLLFYNEALCNTIMYQPVPIHQSAYTNWNGINRKVKRQRAEALLEKSKAAEMKVYISKTKKSEHQHYLSKMKGGLGVMQMCLIECCWVGCYFLGLLIVSLHWSDCVIILGQCLNWITAC